MKITLENIGKRYNTEWIFRGLNCEFITGNNYVILGSNGSGKSTLLQIIAGHFFSSEGKISYLINEKKTEVESIFRHLSIATPYMELIEEFTLRELIKFQHKFKPAMFEESQMIEIMELTSSADKLIRYFSSGMKQRVKLGLAALSKAPALFLDEPVSNLDQNGINWYKNLIQDYCKNKLIIVCSNNQNSEYFFCNQEIVIEDYKKQESPKAPAN